MKKKTTDTDAVHLLPVVLVGNFRELGFTNDASNDSSAAMRQQRTTLHKTEVLNFLRAGKPLTAAPEHTHDVYTGERVTVPSIIVTNAVYAWPLVLAYYVEHYNIALPTAFETHMACHHWQISDDIDVNRLALDPEIVK